uniref:Uncharacterized protein n=1 Tax=Tetranychus urticae TaxID=32264 RepID=T1KDL4_TETUR
MKFKFLKGRPKIWICCFILCALQSYDLIKNFIEFDVRSEIIYNFSEPIEVPDMDFFFPIVTLLNFSAFYHRRPTELVYWCKTLFNKPNVTINSVQEFDQHCSNLSLLITQSSTWLPALLTVGDVEELTQDPREVIDGITNMEGTPYEMFSRKICTKKRFLCGFGVFVRISCRNGSLPLTSEKGGLGGNNYILTIQHRIDQTFGFRFASHKRNIKSKASEYLFIEPSKDHFYSVFAYFNRQVTTSLPWPYKTKCINYNKDKTMAECLNSHLLNLSKPTISLDSVIPFKYYPRNTRFTNGFLESSGLFMEFLGQCTKLVEKPECREVAYHTNAKIYVDSAPAAGSSTMSTMIVDKPIDPDLHVIAHEKWTFVEFLVSLYSILAIYFGVNVFFKLKQRLTTLNKCFDKSHNDQKNGPKKRAFIIVDPNRTFPLYY